MLFRLRRHCEESPTGTTKQSVYPNTCSCGNWNSRKRAVREIQFPNQLRSLFIIFLFFALFFTLSNNLYSQATYTNGSILIYSTTSDPGFPYGRDRFDSLGAVLRNHGYAVTVTDRIIIAVVTDSLLADYNELWIMSTYVPSVAQFSQSEIETILNFRNQGNGLFVDADHYTAGVEDYQDDANQISIPLGVTFFGSAYRAVGCAPIVPAFVMHPLFAGVDAIAGGYDEGKIKRTSDAALEIVATIDQDSMVAVLDDGTGKGRAVFDVCFVRFFDGGCLEADNTIQYARNIADWLINKPPTAFSLISPPLIDSVKSPFTANWQTSLAPYPNDTVRYDLCLSRSIVFNPDSTIIIDSLSDTTYTIGSLDIENWYWKVKAYDQWGAVRWSDQNWSFYVYLCGDANGDGKVSVSDVVYDINYLFKGGSPPAPFKAGDATCDSKVTVAEVIFKVSYLFKGGPPPCHQCP